MMSMKMITMIAMGGRATTVVQWIQMMIDGALRCPVMVTKATCGKDITIVITDATSAK